MRWIAIAGLMLVGCNSPASIEVEPERPLLTNTTDSLQLQVKVKDDKGSVMSGVPVTFRSLTPTMATVDELGNVKAITSGMATILIDAGKISKQVEVLIQIPKKIVVTTESIMPLMLGVTTSFKGTVYDDRNKPMIAGEIRWTSSDPAIFTVDKHGNVKTLTEGSAKLTAHAAGITNSIDIDVKHEELHEDGTLSQ